MQIKSLVRMSVLAGLFIGLDVVDAAEKLFPSELAERQWVSFTADGFSEPVMGVIYRGGTMKPGMPLGGVGTGFISLGTDGTLDYVSTIFNAFLERYDAAVLNSKAEDFPTNLMLRRHVPSFPLPFLGIAVGGKTYVLSHQKVKGTQGVDGIAYWGHYPVADLEYETKCPLSISMRAWTPFLPGDSAVSNTPGAVFEVRLRNVTKTEQQAALVFNFRGPRVAEVGGPEYGLVGEEFGNTARYEHLPVKGKFRGVTVRTIRKGNYEYGYALGVAEPERIRIGGNLGGGSMHIEGNAWDSIAASLPKPMQNHGGSSVAVDFSLSPGQSKTVHFILTWYAPSWRPSPGSDKTYVHMYQSRFKSALDVAELLAEEHVTLLNRILAWQQVVYTEKKLPGWLQDSLINVLGIVPQNSFWVKSAEPNHPWGDEGAFCMNESLASCPVQSAIAGDWIGQWSIDMFYPDLSRNNLRIFKKTQKDNGEILFAWGSRIDLETPFYVFQIPMNSQYYVHLIDRLWQHSGQDKDIIQEFYPSAKAAVNFIRSLDQDEDGLLETEGAFSQYYDNWELAGVATHIAGYWLATQTIVKRMAEERGDDGFVQECDAWIARGKKTLEEKLWNEEKESYYQFKATKSDRTSDVILSDQLIGQWFTQVHGLPGVFSPERIKKVLATLERENAAATPHGIQNAVPPNSGWDNSAIVPSYSTLVPSMLMLYSDDSHFHELGLEIVRKTWHNMTMVQNMTWDQPCMLHADGTASYGLEYHHNTMLWSYPMAVLRQDIQTISSPGGFIHRIIQAGRKN